MNGTQDCFVLLMTSLFVVSVLCRTTFPNSNDLRVLCSTLFPSSSKCDPASNQSSSLFCSGNLIPTYIANLFLCSNSVGLDRCVLSLDNFRAPTLVMALISVFFFEQGAHLILHCDIKLMYHSLLLNSVLQSPWPSSIASLFFFTHSHIPFL